MKIKAIFSVAAVATMALMLTSCVKDWTCTCTYESGSASANDTFTYHSNKKSAQAACDANEATLGTMSTTCTLN